MSLWIWALIVCEALCFIPTFRFCFRDFWDATEGGGWFCFSLFAAAYFGIIAGLAVTPYLVLSRVFAGRVDLRRAGQFVGGVDRQRSADRIADLEAQNRRLERELGLDRETAA